MSIQLSEVTRKFGERTILDRISMEIKEGEFVSLLGPSGSGKTTLLRILAGLDLDSTGDLNIGAEFHIEKRGHRAFVFQEAQLLPWRNAWQNVAVPLELMREPPRETKQKAVEALARVGLSDAAELYPHELSGGMKMRVSFARAIVTKPRLLLLDEPFAALDESVRYRLQEDVRLLWKSLGMTVVFVTHSVTEAVFLSTRAILIAGSPARILRDLQIELPMGERNFQTRTSSEFNAQVSSLHGAMFNFADPQNRNLR